MFLSLLMLALLAVAVHFGGGITGSVIVELSDDKTIVVPVRAHVIKDSSNAYTSLRSESNIDGLFLNANKIWSRTGIYFRVEEIVVTEVSPETIPKVINGDYLGLYNHENFDDSKFNIFFVHNLNGINGIAFPTIGSAFITDVTTVNDFRTTAHELGHLLELKHVEFRNRLMARGENGEYIDTRESKIAKENALELFSLS